jgi:hypothetical protein
MAKSKKESNNLEHTVRVRVSEDEWEEWQRAARKAKFTTVSEWIRHAMRHAIRLTVSHNVATKAK